MDGVQSFAAVMAVIVLSVASFVVIGLGARILWRIGSRRSASAPVPTTVDERRMERLELAIDAIAIEVERVSEAQRFTASLLAERLPARGAEPATDAARGLPTSVPRATTPH